jgi:PilZ domain-containing protein
VEPQVEDLRSSDRYILTEKLSGSFGSAQVVLIDIGEQGVQIEHAQPLRLATKGRLWFKHAGVSVSLHAFVVWSKLSGKQYRSGLRIDEGAAEFVSALNTLAAHGIIRKDDDSLNRKRQRIEDRQKAKSGQPVMKHVATEPDISPDQVLLIQHARKRLKDNFDEAQKWYSRAYFALRTTGEAAKYPEDVLAVWEYLERSVPLTVIKRVFEM